MSSQEIQSLFPLKAEITQEIIDRSNVKDLYNCIGANTLRKALTTLGVYEHIGWMNLSGAIKLSEKQSLPISTKEEVRMVSVKKPQTVTFIIV
jgi:hypothetical protein